MIHFYKLNGYNIALDSPGGAVHVLSDLAYDLLSRLRPPLGDSCPDELLDGFDDREAAAEAYGDLYALYRAGMLFSEDWDAGTVNPAGFIKSLCLNVAHDCNMR